MHLRSDILNVQDELYVVKRKFKVKSFQKVLDHFDTKVVCQNYHCETILKSKDGMFYLCDKIDDAQIV